MPSIVVVGAGLTGLVCAWRLQRAGHDVEVLERSARVGGRAGSELHGDHRIEHAPPGISLAPSTLRGVAQSVGLGDAVHSVEPLRCAVLRAGTLHVVDLGRPRSLLRTPLLTHRARLQLARFAVTSRRDRAQLDPRHPELAAGLDVDDAATDLGRAAGLEARDFLLEPLLRSILGGPLESSSAAFARVALRALAEGACVETLSDGLGRLVDALADRLSVRTGCEALSVETETGGARVRYRASGRERLALADAAVLAVPGPEVADLCAKLTPVERGFFEGVRSARALRAHLLFDEAPQIPGASHGFAVLFPAVTGLELALLSVDHEHGAAPPGAGLLSASFAEEATRRLWSAPDDRVGARALAALGRTPIGALQPRAVVVSRAEHAQPSFGPGSLARLGAFLGRSDASPRLVFAGDYLVGPYTEGALRSGLRAASEVVRRLDA